jgi:hypothetical protein
MAMIPLSDLMVPAVIGVVTLAFAHGLYVSVFEAKKRRRRSCKADIQDGLKNDLLEWEDLDILAQRWKQSRADVHWILSDLLHESLSGKDEKGKELCQKVKGLVKKQQSTEPYSELPESIRIHVEGISSRFSERGDEVLRPLVTAICDIIVEADNKASAQRAITKYSFVIGITSLLIGIASLAFALSEIRAHTAQEVPNNSTSIKVTD